MKCVVTHLAKTTNVGLASENVFFSAKHAMRRNHESSLLDIKCVSQKYMIMNGLIEHCGATGLYAYSPHLMRSLDKLSLITQSYMKRLRAHKILLPSLSPYHIWEESGRAQLLLSELMTVNENTREKHLDKLQLCLSPTFEEMITILASKCHLSASQLPWAMYQIGPKFRNEPRPKNGLLRTKEFIMKDMYSFHESESDCMSFYNRARQSYKDFLIDIGFEWNKNLFEVEASSGAMGGSISHEFHVIADAGEDTINKCSTCESFYSPEVHSCCPKCRPTGQCNDVAHRSIEVGHTFVLGTKYSQIFNCIAKRDADDYKDKQKQSKLDRTVTTHMGCYGLGLSRILPAFIECYFSTKASDEDVNYLQNVNYTNFVWSPKLAPVVLYVVLPKTGSKEETQAETLIAQLTKIRETMSPKMILDDVLIDDRYGSTIGKKITDAKFMGCPYILVLGKSLLDKSSPTFELVDRVKGTTHNISVDCFVETVQNIANYQHLM